MLRPATMDDAALLFAWANDPETRVQSFNSDPIPWDGHVAWLGRVLADPARVVWLLCDPVPVASIRFDAEVGRAVVSVQVAPERRGNGYGARVVAEASALYVTATGRTIDAEIKPGNTASVRTFERAGYALADSGDPLRYELRPGDLRREHEPVGR